MKFASLKNIHIPVPKDKPTYSEKYKKNTVVSSGDSLVMISNCLKECGYIHMIEHGCYQSGEEFMVIKIDRIPKQ